MNARNLKTLLPWVASVVAAVALSAPSDYSAGKNCCSFARVPLHALAGGDLGNYWRVESAELRETPSATWGFVAVQTTSNSPVENARFYGELFDAEGRFCFSLAFSLASNEEGRGLPIHPGELRTLRSVAVSLSPVVEPKELRLYLIAQTSLTSQRVVSGTAPPMRVPPLISGGGSASLCSITLKNGLVPPEGWMVDLALARVRVESTGHPLTIDVLDTRNADLERWTKEFVSQPNQFRSASNGETPADADVLILVRAFSSRSAYEDPRFLPRLSPWITTYLAARHDSEPPPINIVLFAPAPKRTKLPGSTDWIDLPSPPPGLFRIVSGGPEWCPGLFDYKPSAITGHWVRVWRE